MSYTPHEWQNNEFITAEKLNNIEEGIAAGGSGAVIITDNGTQLDKTYAEIYNLVNSGTPCYIKYNLNGSQNDLDTDYMYHTVLMPVVAVMKYSSNYRIYASCSYGLPLGSLEYLGFPSIWVYQVSASTAYPTFYQMCSVKQDSMTAYGVRYV